MTTRAGFVALIGEPNAGKSTLTNTLVGAKVSIVTHKVQTTRARIRGVAIEGDSQIVLVDTPGLFKPRRRLDRAMVAAAWGGAADADVIVLLIEAHRGITDGVRSILENLNDVAGQRPVALAINKIDRVEASKLLSLTQAMNEAYLAGYMHKSASWAVPIAGGLNAWNTGKGATNQPQQMPAHAGAARPNVGWGQMGSDMALTNSSVSFPLKTFTTNFPPGLSVCSHTQRASSQR